MVKNNEPGRVVASAVKTEAAAPLVGAPAEYLNEAPRQGVYPLEHPFKLAGVEYRDLTYRRMNGKEIFAVNKAMRAGVDPEAAMFSAMCKVPVEVIHSLDAQDITGLSQASANFMPRLASTSDEPTGESGDNT